MLMNTLGNACQLSIKIQRLHNENAVKNSGMIALLIVPTRSIPFRHPKVLLIGVLQSRNIHSNPTIA